jgi:hypothetical protein
MSSHDSDDDEPDAVLRILGHTLIGRVRSGEVGVFSSIEVQTQVLDAMDAAPASIKHELQPLKQIFEETKVVRARAHKLERLVSERIAASGGGSTQTNAAVNEGTTANDAPTDEEPPSKPPKTESHPVKRKQQEEPPHPKPEAAPHQAQSEKTKHPEEERPKSRQEPPEGELVELQDSLEYRLSAWLVAHGGTVRLRSQPNKEAEAVGLVDADTTIVVSGMTPLWFKVAKPVDSWALRHAPDGRLLFHRTEHAKTDAFASQSTQAETVSLEEFRDLVLRVKQLEAQLEDMRKVLRSV